MAIKTNMGETMIRMIFAATALLAASTLAMPAAAAECGAGGSGATTIFYDTGHTKLTADHKARLAEFAEIAKHRDAVCVFAQVDAQGTPEANARVADARAKNVRRHLIKLGVPADRILIATETEGQTLFGLFEDDQKNERRVTVSYE